MCYLLLEILLIPNFYLFLNTLENLSQRIRLLPLPIRDLCSVANYLQQILQNFQTCHMDGKSYTCTYTRYLVNSQNAAAQKVLKDLFITYKIWLYKPQDLDKSKKTHC